MFARQRVLLEFLGQSTVPPTKLELVKWLFLAGQETDISSRVAFYSFLPYRYGPFSFILYKDLDSLRRDGWLAMNPGSRVHIPIGRVADPELGKLPEAVRQAVNSILQRYSGLSRPALIDTVYKTYPWYASRSLLRPRKRRRPGVARAVYTVGYQGRSIDAFLNQLLRRGISLLVDVRRNAYSQQRAFCKGALRTLCEKVGISYCHVPALGVPADRRQHLDSRAAYEALFKYYDESVLPQQTSEIHRVGEMLKRSPGALLCFEANACECHRGRLSRVLAERTGLSEVHL
jgi:hypothetical protein